MTRRFALLALLVVAPGLVAAQTSVTLTAPDGQTVTIDRDAYGVPVIGAGTERALFFGQGFAVAQDRLFQMETFWRSATGRLAELQGAAALTQDQQVRTVYYTPAERASAVRRALRARPDDARRVHRRHQRLHRLDGRAAGGVPAGRVHAGRRGAGAVGPRQDGRRAAVLYAPLRRGRRAGAHAPRRARRAGRGVVRDQPAGQRPGRGDDDHQRAAARRARPQRWSGRCRGRPGLRRWGPRLRANRLGRAHSPARRVRRVPLGPRRAAEVRLVRRDRVRRPLRRPTRCCSARRRWAPRRRRPRPSRARSRSASPAATSSAG